MGRSTSGSEAESRKPRKNAMEQDDRQAYRHKDVQLQSDEGVLMTINKPKNRKPVDQLGSNGKIQKYSYAKEQESHEKRLYARNGNGKEAYQAYGYQRHAKEEYQGYSSNVRTGRRSSPPPPMLQMMKYENPMLKKKAAAYKDNDSGTSSEEDEDEYRGNERVGRSSPSPKLQVMKNQTDPMLKKKAAAHKGNNRTFSEEDKDESSSSDDDKASYDIFKRMSRMELNSSKFMKTKMMKW